MNLHPFYEVAKTAGEAVARGDTVHQQFKCAGCGIKQTMEKPDAFFTKGTCEECGHVTDIEKDGCNFMVIRRFK